MRVNKRAQVVEAKKTRTCVVRLEKVDSSPSPPPTSQSTIVARTTRAAYTGASTNTIETTTNTMNSNRSTQQQQQQQQQRLLSQAEAKMLRGPLKKRPLAHAALLAATKARVKSMQQKGILLHHTDHDEMDGTPPPTIAAGRSRRAIKPNPKYTSGDMVTPKLIKNVGVLGSASAAAADGKRDKQQQQQQRRRTSTSSSEDFFNKASSDEEEEPMVQRSLGGADKGPVEDELEDGEIADEDDEQADRAYQEDKNSDSNYSDAEPEVIVTPKRGRGRPRKNQLTPLGSAVTPKATTTTTRNATGSATKVTPIQQLRKTLAATASANRMAVMASAVSGGKRKMELNYNDGDSGEPNVTSKRFKMPSGSAKNVTSSSTGRRSSAGAGAGAGETSNKTVGIRGTMHTLNGSKIINIPTSSLQPSLTAGGEMRKYLLERSLNKARLSTSSNSGTSPKQQQQQSLPKPMAQKQGAPKHQLTVKQQQTLQKHQQLHKQQQQQRQRQQEQQLISRQPASTGGKRVYTIGGKPRSTSPGNTATAAPKPKTIILEKHTHDGSDMLEAKAAAKKKDASDGDANGDGGEAMNTFTIVNINDIINKKGDALISKSAVGGSKTDANVKKITLKASEVTTPAAGDAKGASGVGAGAAATPTDGRLNRRKTSHTTILTEKLEPELMKPPLPRTPFPPKRTATRTGGSGGDGGSAGGAQTKLLNASLNAKNAQTANTNTPVAQQILRRRGLQQVSTVAKPFGNTPKQKPRILNSVVAKRTEPVKPLITNVLDSPDGSHQYSFEEDDEMNGVDRITDDADDEVEKESNDANVSMSTQKTPLVTKKLITSTPLNVNSTTSTVATTTTTASAAKKLPTQQKQQQQQHVATKSTTPIAVASAATKENSLAATNRLPVKPVRKGALAEKTVTRQGDKIIRRVTCFENWYVLNLPPDNDDDVDVNGRYTTRYTRNTLEMPLMELANAAASIQLPSAAWSSKVTLYTTNNNNNNNNNNSNNNNNNNKSITSTSSAAKATGNNNDETQQIIYTGDLSEFNIKEEDRIKQQPTCVMFRRAANVTERNTKNAIMKSTARLPFDRAVIFKNKTFYTNIEGKNIKLKAAPTTISSEHEVQILLEIIDSLTLQSSLVETATVPTAAMTMMAAVH